MHYSGAFDDIFGGTEAFEYLLRYLPVSCHKRYRSPTILANRILRCGKFMVYSRRKRRGIVEQMVLTGLNQ